jgi:hypothetical protein
MGTVPLESIRIHLRVPPPTIILMGTVPLESIRVHVWVPLPTIILMGTVPLESIRVHLRVPPANHYSWKQYHWRVTGFICGSPLPTITHGNSTTGIRVHLRVPPANHHSHGNSTTGEYQGSSAGPPCQQSLSWEQ